MTRTRSQDLKASNAPPGRVRGLLLLGACLLASVSSAQWGPWVPAQHPGLRWEGRVRFEADRSATYDWASVRVHAKFQGDALAVYARLGQNYLDVLVDGERVAVLGAKSSAEGLAWEGIGIPPQATGGIPVYVVRGLAPGAHRLTVAKRSGPNFGPVTLLGFRFASPEPLPQPPAAHPRRLEFIGDSLTNGYGLEGPGLQCKTLAAYENSSRAWARACAESLHAEAQILAYSGYGLVRNYGAAGSASDDPVPFYYPRRVLADPAPWPREDYVPDLSVIFLGTNDYSTQPGPSAQAFEDAYAAFLGQVREGREGLKILLAYPDDGGVLSKRVKAVVDSQQALGQDVVFRELPRTVAVRHGRPVHRGGAGVPARPRRPDH